MLKSVRLYGTLTPRMRGRKSFMLVKSDYDSMLAAENPQAVIRRLEGTPYQPFIAQMLIGEFDLGKAEEGLMRAYQTEVDFILSRLRSKRALDFFEEIHRSLELRCLTSILKAIILDVKWEEALRYLFPYGKVDASACRTLIEERNIKKVVELIKEKPLADEVQKIVKETEDPSRRALEVEMAVHRYASMKTWEKLVNLGGRDRQCIRLTGITVDMLNILTVLRLKKLGFKPDEIGAYITPIFYRVSPHELKRAATAPSEKDSIKILTTGHYVKVISPLISTYDVKEDLSIFETAFNRFHSDECEKTFLRPMFHLGEAQAYLYLRWYEARDLIAILVGKYFGLPADKIELSMVLHQPPYPI